MKTIKSISGKDIAIKNNSNKYIKLKDIYGINIFVKIHSRSYEPFDVGIDL